MSQDKTFFDTFMLILGILVFIAIAIYYLSRSIASDTQDVYVHEDQMYQEELMNRIKPVGQVNVAGQPRVAEPAPAPVQVAQAAKSGEEVYNSACVACHGAGIAGAPKMGDAADWDPRIAQGMDTLYKNAIDGYQGSGGLMPPKGGFASLSDAEVKAAVDYMADNSK